MLETADRLWRGEADIAEEHQFFPETSVTEVADGVSFVRSFANVSAFATGDGLVLVVGLAASPVIVLLVRPGSDLDTAGIIVAEALAIVLLRLAFRTCYVRAPVPAPAGSGHAPPVEVELTALATAGGGDGASGDRGASGGAEGGDEAPPEEAEPETAHEEKRPVPSTAWTLGVLAARARRRGTGSDRVLGAGARRLGTALGRANRRRSD